MDQSDKCPLADKHPLAIEVDQLSKTFGKTQALSNVSLQAAPGEMVALIGPSGSGKSTLLKHLSGLHISDDSSGYVRALEKTVQISGDLNTKIRHIRADIGFIFQQFNLVGRLSLLKNVLAGMLSQVPIWRSLFGWFTYSEKYTAVQALAKVGMAEYAAQRASTLSGGQQQRAAIARALVQKANVILADEPIASLDPESSRKVMRMLRKVNRENKITVLVSLHQVDFAMQFCDRCVGLRNGQIVYDGPSSELTTAILQNLYGTEFCDVEEGLDIYSKIKKKKNEEIDRDDTCIEVNMPVPQLAP
ncbi:MAG: phosphonate ABC transporter ATP-binding protein [Desulfobacteraceae bacterium]|jgi:phosphonate transport system ATP-binding protein